jgi:16S rRNA G966 N2-methylase RsmD
MSTAVELITPQRVFHEPDVARLQASNDHYEIEVSFRGPDGSVGRRDFATHWIHWYPAKMFHRIPSVFLETVNLPSESTILDPFCGSGTVLLEANVRGYHAVGIDINPLARLISQVKTTPINPDDLKCQLAVILRKALRSRALPDPQPTLDYWISAPARVGIHRLSDAIRQIVDGDCRAFFVVALSSIIRQISLADPAIPPLVRLREERADVAGIRYQKALQKAKSTTTSSVYDTFVAAATSNIQRMSELERLRKTLGHSQVSETSEEAAQTRLLPESVDAVITSPPYCGSQKYVRSLKLELLVSGYQEEEIREIDRRTLGTEAVSTRTTPIADLLIGDGYTDQVIRDVYATNPVRARIVSDYSSYLFAWARE